MSEHTKGRLTARGTVVLFANTVGGFDIYRCPAAYENAHRLVACWNACEAMVEPEAEVNALIEALRSEAGQLRTWAVESRNGGWSTHQVDPMRRRADEINTLLSRYPKESQ